MWNESMIKSFLILASASSFTEAAKRTFFTQQAISKQIKRLELELGCELVIRERGNVHLTEEGKIYYSAFQEAMDAIHEADNKVARIKAREGGEIHLGLLEMLVIDPVWDAYLKDYHARFPDIGIITKSCSDLEIMEDLLNNRSDLVITFSMDDPEKYNLDYIEIGESWQEKLCVSKNYPGAKEAKSVKDLKDIPVLLPVYDPERGIRRVREIGLSTENVRYTQNISSALHSVIMLEGGIIVGDHIYFRDNPELIFFDLGIRPRPPCLMWKKDNPNRAMKFFLEQFRIFAANWNEKNHDDSGGSDNYNFELLSPN